LGTDEVVEAFNDMMQYFYHSGENPDPTSLIDTWGRFIIVLRKNLGNTKTKLSRVDMLRSQIKDIDSFLK